MAHILVIGASDGIGHETVKQGLKAGHHIRAFARSAARISIEDSAFEAFPGDATSPEDITAALVGIDTVIDTLGVPLKPATVLRRVTLFSKATELLIPAMQEAGVRRLITVTGFGAGDSRSKVSIVEKSTFHTILGAVYADKDRQEEMIAESDLNWTLVRPGILTPGSLKRRYRVLVEPESWHNGLIARADVAHFCLEAVNRDDLIGRKPVIVY